MTVTSLIVDRFTAFSTAEFDLSPGLNVLVGENGSGKSHVLKLLYAMYQALRENWGESEEQVPLDARTERYLNQVFRPDSVGRLVRRAGGVKDVSKTALASIVVNRTPFSFTLTHKGTLKTTSARNPFEETSASPAIFVPTRELLSMYPGFAAAWEDRELSFDRTYYDLCRALSRAPLKGARAAEKRALLEPIEKALGGTVYVAGGRFYVKHPDGDMEAPLLAEGVRKLAMLAYLIINGSLKAGSLLLWDEPEASMNPAMAPLLAKTAFELADQGVQIVMATHDYVLTSELGLEAERRRQAHAAQESAFFAISREEGARHTRTIDRATSLAGLRYNPILEAMAALHGRELEFENSEQGE